MKDPDDLERTEELFTFLQGDIPDGYRIADDRIPHLTAEQAWTVIWYLGNQYWQVPDYIERCDVCGELFDTTREGDYLDGDGSPCHVCEECEYSPEAEAKHAKEE